MFPRFRCSSEICMLANTHELKTVIRWAANCGHWRADSAVGRKSQAKMPSSAGLSRVSTSEKLTRVLGATWMMNPTPLSSRCRCRCSISEALALRAVGTGLWVKSASRKVMGAAFIRLIGGLIKIWELSFGSQYKKLPIDEPD